VNRVPYLARHHAKTLITAFTCQAMMTRYVFTCSTFTGLTVTEVTESSYYCPVYKKIIRMPWLQCFFRTFDGVSSVACGLPCSRPTEAESHGSVHACTQRSFSGLVPESVTSVGESRRRGCPYRLTIPQSTDLQSHV
jgi:hypothetical protein